MSNLEEDENSNWQMELFKGHRGLEKKNFCSHRDLFDLGLGLQILHWVHWLEKPGWLGYKLGSKRWSTTGYNDSRSRVWILVAATTFLAFTISVTELQALVSMRKLLLPLRHNVSCYECYMQQMRLNWTNIVKKIWDDLEKELWVFLSLRVIIVCLTRK